MRTCLFFCGRIGHSQRACPDEEFSVGGCAFGPELRASPVKKSEVKEIRIPVNQLQMKRSLNCSGDQAKRVMSGASSSIILSDASVKKHDARASKESRTMEVDGEAINQDDLAHDNPSNMPGEVQDMLRSGVQELQVQDDTSNVSKQKTLAGDGIVVLMQDTVVKSGHDQGRWRKETLLKEARWTGRLRACLQTWWVLRMSPTRHNEYPSVELSGAGGPPNSSGAMCVDPDAQPRPCLPI
jgi:hypothetical protein